MRPLGNPAPIQREGDLVQGIPQLVRGARGEVIEQLNLQVLRSLQGIRTGITWLYRERRP